MCDKKERHLRISLAATEDSGGTVRGSTGFGALLQNLLHQGLEGILHLQVLLRLHEEADTQISRHGKDSFNRIRQ